MGDNTKFSFLQKLGTGFAMSMAPLINAGLLKLTDSKELLKKDADWVKMKLDSNINHIFFMPNWYITF